METVNAPNAQYKNQKRIICLYNLEMAQIKLYLIHLCHFWQLRKSKTIVQFYLLFSVQNACNNILCVYAFGW